MAAQAPIVVRPPEGLSHVTQGQDNNDSDLDESVGVPSSNVSVTSSVLGGEFDSGRFVSGPIHLSWRPGYRVADSQLSQYHKANQDYNYYLPNDEREYNREELKHILCVNLLEYAPMQDGRQDAADTTIAGESCSRPRQHDSIRSLTLAPALAPGLLMVSVDPSFLPSARSPPC